MPPKKKKTKKPIRKITRKKVDKRTPVEKIMAIFVEIVPAVKDATGDALESWTLFAQKLLLAKRLKTSVNVITVNPVMLEHRELLQKAFACSIQSPTEARFGLDSIQTY